MVWDVFQFELPAVLTGCDGCVGIGSVAEQNLGPVGVVHEAAVPFLAVNTWWRSSQISPEIINVTSL